MLLSAIALSLGLAAQPALHQQVDYVSPSPHTCSLKQKLDPAKVFSLGKYFFEKAESNYNSQDYDSAVVCFNSVLESPDGNNLWREASYYSAMALWLGTEPKQTEEAESKFCDVISYGVKDEIMELSLHALFKISLNNADQNDYLDLEKAISWLERLKKEFPNSVMIESAETDLRTISEGPDDDPETR